MQEKRLQSHVVRIKTHHERGCHVDLIEPRRAEDREADGRKIDSQKYIYLCSCVLYAGEREGLSPGTFFFT